jgi:DNA-binding LacI/PurR family transcriptional regulator
MRNVKREDQARRPTVRDVAAVAGVSHQTVSRVINDHGYVNEGTRERVTAAIKQLDYVPNAIARSLSSDRTHTIGVVTNDISDHFFAEFVAGAEAEARSHDLFLLIGSVEEAVPDDEEAYLRVMLQRRLEGLIVARPVLAAASQRRLRSIASRMPVVLVASQPELHGLPSVDVDNQAGGRDATAYLLELGHRQIATITGPLEWTSGARRLAGYRAALLASAAGFDATLVESCDDWGLEAGAAAMNRLLDRGGAFTAVFAHSDLLAIGAITALRQRGLRVPADVSVVGYDDIPVARFVDPALTTMRQPMREVGRAALTMLLDGREGRLQGDGQVLLPAELMVRDSAGARG